LLGSAQSCGFSSHYAVPDFPGTEALRYSANSSAPLSLLKDDLKAELCRKCERLDREFAEGVAENRALAEANEHLRITLSARRKRLQEAEVEAEEQEKSARSHFEDLERKNREEWQQVESLRCLVAHTLNPKTLNPTP